MAAETKVNPFHMLSKECKSNLSVDCGRGESKPLCLCEAALCAIQVISRGFSVIYHLHTMVERDIP